MRGPEPPIYIYRIDYRELALPLFLAPTRPSLSFLPLFPSFVLASAPAPRTPFRPDRYFSVISFE
jgi:hypothetical protein